VPFQLALHFDLVQLDHVFLPRNGQAVAAAFEIVRAELDLAAGVDGAAGRLDVELFAADGELDLPAVLRRQVRPAVDDLDDQVPPPAPPHLRIPLRLPLHPP